MKRRVVDLASKSVPEIVQDSIQTYKIEDFYIGIPAVVASNKDYEEQQVLDVIPLIDDVYKDGVIVQPPLLRSIFVKLRSGGGFSELLPVKAGDLVTLHYTHRNLTTFLDGRGSAVEVPIDLMGGLKDCYATIGFGTRSVNQKPSVTDYILVGPNTKQTTKPDGTQISEFPNTTLTINPNGTVNLVTSALYTIDAPDTLIKGTLTVDGATTLKSTLDVTLMSTHLAGIKAPSYAATSGAAGGGTMTIGTATIESTTISGAATIGGILFSTHKHPENGTGGGTTGNPQ